MGGEDEDHTAPGCPWLLWSLKGREIEACVATRAMCCLLQVKYITLPCLTIHRCFTNENGLRKHLKFCQKAKKCQTKPGPKECWLVPAKESRSPWDWFYLTKEMFMNALQLEVCYLRFTLKITFILR